MAISGKPKLAIHAGFIEGVVLTLTRVPDGTDDPQGVQSASGDGVMELVTVTK